MATDLGGILRKLTSRSLASFLNGRHAGLSLNILGMIFARILSAGYFFVITGIVARNLPPAALATALSLVVATSIVPFIQLGLGSSVVRAITSNEEWQLSAEVSSILSTVRITALFGAIGFGVAAMLVGNSTHLSLLLLLVSLSSITALTQSAEWALTGMGKNRVIAAIYATTTIAAISCSAVFPPHALLSSFLYIYMPPIISSALVFVIALTTSEKFRVASGAKLLPELPYVAKALGPGLVFTISAALLNTLPQGVSAATASTSPSGLPLLRMILSVTTILAAAVLPIIVQLARNRNDEKPPERAINSALLAYAVAGFAFTYVAAPMVIKIWLGPTSSPLTGADRLFGAMLAGVWVPSSFMLQREFISGSRWLAATSLAIGAIAAFLGWALNHFVAPVFTPLSLQFLAVTLSVAPQMAAMRFGGRRQPK